jgi:hypothetical protein
VLIDSLKMALRCRNIVFYDLYSIVFWERDHLGDPGIDGRIILRWISRKWDVRV